MKILTIKLLNALISGNNAHRIKGRCKIIKDRTYVQETKDICNFDIKYGAGYIRLQWSDDMGDPCVSVQSENQPINFLENCGDSEYQYLLYID